MRESRFAYVLRHLAVGNSQTERAETPKSALKVKATWPVGPNCTLNIQTLSRFKSLSRKSWIPKDLPNTDLSFKELLD